jgi:hypothetical protein
VLHPPLESENGIFLPLVKIMCDYHFYAP